MQKTQHLKWCHTEWMTQEQKESAQAKLNMIALQKKLKEKIKKGRNNQKN